MPPKSTAALTTASTLTSPTTASPAPAPAPDRDDDPVPPPADEDEEDAPDSDPERTEQEAQANAQQQAVMLGLGELDLPKTVVTKLARGELAESAKVQQDVILRLIKSATVFVSYLAAAAHDQTTLLSNRKTILPQDVIDAVRASGLDGVVGKEERGGLGDVLERELEAYRALHSSKKTNTGTTNGATAGPSSKKSKTAPSNGKTNGRKSNGGAGKTGAQTKAGGRQQAEVVIDGAEGEEEEEQEEEEGHGRVGSQHAAEDQEAEQARKAVGVDERDGMDVDVDVHGVGQDDGTEEAIEEKGEERMDKRLREEDVGAGVESD